MHVSYARARHKKVNNNIDIVTHSGPRQIAHTTQNVPLTHVSYGIGLGKMLGHSDCDMRQTARTALVSVMLALALVFNTATSSSINVYPHVHNNKMPQINRATRVVHPNDMGVFKLQSSGPLVLANGTVVVVAAVTYLKTMPHADGQLELRCDALDRCCNHHNHHAGLCPTCTIHCPRSQTLCWTSGRCTCCP